MIFRDLQRGARFRCHLPDIRSPVECVKLSKTRFRVIGGTYHKTKVDSFPVALIPKQQRSQGKLTMITDKKGFNVVCTNPEKSAAIEACWFSYEDWTEDDAMQQFATDYGLELSEVAIEKED